MSETRPADQDRDQQRDREQLPVPVSGPGEKRVLLSCAKRMRPLRPQKTRRYNRAIRQKWFEDFMNAFGYDDESMQELKKELRTKYPDSFNDDWV